MMSQSNQRAPLTGSVFDRYRHVCVFYNSQNEEYRILLPFIKEEFDKGDKTFHIIDERNRPEHLRRLKEAGIDDDCAKFSARAVVDTIRCHPMAIIGGIVQVNPFFVPPDELLQELHEGKRGVA
jgi:hypothetical protein